MILQMNTLAMITIKELPLWGLGSLLCIILLGGGGLFFYRHQCLLRDRAHLMREAIRNREFTFSLPVKGLFFGEKALQQALNDLGKDINQLVAQNEVESWQRLTRVLTHEIMNATAPIQSISQAYLSSPKIKGTDYEEGIRAIYDTSTALANFVDSYRKLTQLQKANITDMPLMAFVEKVRALYPDVEWKVSIPAALTIKADEGLMRQVFINIVKNAIEADAKTIGITYRHSRLAEDEQSGYLLVSNDGTPIPSEVRRDIFIPFFTTKASGSGIGLSLSRQLLMLQNMSLTLADTPENGYHVTYRIIITVR